MSWVRQKSVRPLDSHQCKPPTRERALGVAGFADAHSKDGEPVRTDHVPNGEFGDLWRCDRCQRLWRIGNACDWCDPKPPGTLQSSQGNHPGVVHEPGKTAWRRATWWQRLIYDWK